jgi:hypothetical protein
MRSRTRWLFSFLQGERCSMLTRDIGRPPFNDIAWFTTRCLNSLRRVYTLCLLPPRRRQKFKCLPSIIEFNVGITLGFLECIVRRFDFNTLLTVWHSMKYGFFCLHGTNPHLERIPLWFLPRLLLFIRPGQKLGEIPQTRYSGIGCISGCVRRYTWRRPTKLLKPIHKSSMWVYLILDALVLSACSKSAMRKSSNDTGDRRPTLPSIWDLFRGVRYILIPLSYLPISYPREMNCQTDAIFTLHLLQSTLC